MTEDLWGEIPSAELIRKPETILLEQAELLKAKTEGLLIGKVNSSRSGTGDSFVHNLLIIAPTLGDYSCHILQVQHALGFYPLTVRGIHDKSDFKCKDEEEFRHTLKEILGSEPPRSVIEKLLMHIRSEDPEGFRSSVSGEDTHSASDTPATSRDGDLWGELPDPSPITTPASILREQAGLLEDKTKGLLVGTVGQGGQGNNMQYNLQIVAPALGNYAYEVLTASYGIGFYPVSVIDVHSSQRIECDSEEEFKKALASVLGAESTQATIARLLTHISSEEVSTS